MIIIHLKSTQEMEQLAVALLPALGVEMYLKHQSLNYPPYFIYFEGEVCGFNYKVCGEDDDNYADFQYWLVVRGLKGKPVEAPIIAQIERVLQTLDLKYVIEP